MDTTQFDRLTISLGAATARRGALRLLTGFGLALLATHGADEVAAHNLAAKCNKTKDTKKRKRCFKKARKHNAQHARQEPAPPACETAATCPDRDASQQCATRICANGQCALTPKTAGIDCRPQAGPCDLPETCDGVSLSCPPDRFQPSGQGCAEAFCFNGTMRQLTRRCTGTSASCPPPPPPIDCSPYRCRGFFDGCPTLCLDDDDCVATHVCLGVQCDPRLANGASCGRARQCASGLCVGGVCCDNACVAGQRQTATCAGGTCVLTCDEGFGDCDGSVGNGCETDITSNKQHCGGCGQVCAGPCAPGLIRLCEDGVCACS